MIPLVGRYLLGLEDVNRHAKVQHRSHPFVTESVSFSLFTPHFPATKYPLPTQHYPVGAVGGLERERELPYTEDDALITSNNLYLSDKQTNKTAVDSCSSNRVLHRDELTCAMCYPWANLLKTRVSHGGVMLEDWNIIHAANREHSAHVGDIIKFQLWKGFKQNYNFRR